MPVIGFDMGGTSTDVSRYAGKLFCTPERFNTEILHQLFDHLITFVNSQH